MQEYNVIWKLLQEVTPPPKEATPPPPREPTPPPPRDPTPPIVTIRFTLNSVRGILESKTVLNGVKEC